MALVTRLSRLFQADFHAVLDRIEEPDLQLRQAVREMQIALDNDRQRLRLLEHEAEQLSRQLAATDDRMHRLDEELDICLDAEQDDLARNLVERKLTSEKQAQAIRERIGVVTSQCEGLDRQIDEQAQQLASMKQKLELLVTGDDAPGPGGAYAQDSVCSEEVEIALLREKQRRAKS